MPRNNLTYRVTQLEKNYDKLDGKLDQLLTNDIPHLQQQMIALGTKMGVLTVFNVGALITALLVSKFL